MQKMQSQMNGFATNINKSMAGVGKALKIGLGYISLRAITGFVKTTTSIASDLTEVQNVVDTVFGSMASDINDFAKISIEQFGLSELSAKKYSSTMGAMLKSSGIAGQGVRDMALDLTKLSADMASFYNLDNDAAFQKIMSGMSGMTMPLKELGINMNIANLEAYALSQGINKAYRNMSQAEQTMIRYNYLLSVTGDAQGDFAKNSHTWANQTKILSQQWEILKGTIGAGFINMFLPIVRGFNILIKKIQITAEYFKAFTRLIFGDANGGGTSGSGGGGVIEDMADNLGDAEEGLGGVGKAGKKAGKDLKSALAGFDEINTLAKKTADGAGGLGDSLGGVGAVDLGSASSGELDINTTKMEEKLKRLKELFKDIYENWGMKDLFRGFRDGLDLVNFENIKTNLKTTFSGLGEITMSALQGLQPIFQAAGQTLGTMFKYGIAIAGNYFEPITLGWANFVTNMKDPIQSWITETSSTITNGFNNLTSVFEMLGQSWLNSIEKYKPIIAQTTEDMVSNTANTLMLIGTGLADVFEVITGKLKEFIEENKSDIQKFTDSILGMFTDAWTLINKVWSNTLTELKKFWDTWGKDIVKSTMDVMKDIGKWFLYLWNDLVKPTWDTMVKWLNKIWDESLKGILKQTLDMVGGVAELIKKLWDTVIKPFTDNLLNTFVPIFQNVFKLVVDIVGTAVNAIGKVIENLIKIINGILDFLNGTFSGNWSRAWQGIVKVFEGIIGGIGSIFKGVINGLVSGMNTFIRGANNIKIPDKVPGIGGIGFNIREIPHLAKGGITNGEMIAMIGDNPGGREVVSPLDDLMGMIVEAVSTTNNGSGGDTTIIVKVGEDTITEKVVSNINRQSRISGKTIITV